MLLLRPRTLPGRAQENLHAVAFSQRLAIALHPLSSAALPQIPRRLRMMSDCAANADHESGRVRPAATGVFARVERDDVVVSSTSSQP